MRTALKQFRVGAHMTQDEFAKQLGVCRATYSFIERGERSGTTEFWTALQNQFSVPDEKMWSLQKNDGVKK